MSSGIKVTSLPVTQLSVVTSTMTKLSEAKDRIHWLCKREGTDFYLAYQETAPADTTTMTLIDANYQGDFFDGALCPVCNVWVWHTKGSNLTVTYREGTQG